MSNLLLVDSLRCEFLTNPLGIDVAKPRLSWVLVSEQNNVVQSAYQVQVMRHDAVAVCVWDSGKVLSSASVHLLYDGEPLVSRQRYVWRVRVWDAQDVASPWSEQAWWEMGLLETAVWQAKWIEPVQAPTVPEPPMNMFQNLGTLSPQPDADYQRLRPSQYLRKLFTCSAPIKKARLYATAHGVYCLGLNGERVGDIELAPGVTAYDDYLQYQTYDVTALLQTGDNVLGAVLGDGWYCGRIGLPGDSCQYGDKLALLLQLEIEYENGRFHTIISDESWKTATGALRYSDLFIGERYDARLAPEQWQTPQFDNSGWVNAVEVAYSFDNLVAQYGEPMRVTHRLTAVAILQTPTGETVVDFGQNIHGKINFRVQGEAGTEIVLDYSETLDSDGNFLHQIRGRNKDQRDFYILNGRGAEEYTPWFTTHGFRYVRLTGYPTPPRLEDFRALVVASDLTQTGHFSCSDERLNRLQQNIVWSQRSNLVSIPTDCPQRERAGFTGDAQLFVNTACFNMAVNPFFTRWLCNLRLEQRPDGQVPTIVPYWKSYIDIANTVQQGAHTSAGWGDACIIVPWALYQAYGDEQLLRENYDTMTHWLAYVQREAETAVPERLAGQLSPEETKRQRFLWNSGFHFGDWLIPSLTQGYKNPFEAAQATKEIAASCFYGYCTELMAQIAEVVGNAADQARYASLNAQIRAAFTAEYVADDGRLMSHYQGMYVLALKMKMVPEEKRPFLTNHLVDLIIQNDYRLDTGFVSMPYLMDVLCENGRLDIAYALLMQTECPSWLYEVESGATTIWESWDTITPDGKTNIASHNHYAFGAVGAWLYSTVAGLTKSQPGYKHIHIQPHPHPPLTHAQASYQSIYGTISVSWQLKEGQMHVQTSIPPNTTATIKLPQADSNLFSNHFPTRQDGASAAIEVGSGSYAFKYPFKYPQKRM